PDRHRLGQNRRPAGVSLAGDHVIAVHLAGWVCPSAGRRAYFSIGIPTVALRIVRRTELS
ncbi:hypothetical protein AB4144_50215, partial [Rhizobiaceae sp. 2RAB30]